MIVDKKKNKKRSRNPKENRQNAASSEMEAKGVNKNEMEGENE